MIVTELLKCYYSRPGQAPSQLPVAAQPALVTGYRVALLIWRNREL